MNSQELTNLLESFLDKWTLEDVQKMSLQDYVGVNNHDTFCYWVETKTRMLGSIKGSNSFAFGIYERKQKEKVHKNFKDDERYSWIKRFGENRNEAFENVKEDLIKTIVFSEKGKFSQIDEINLPHLFKWKVAFLYSNERLIPIYKKDILNKIAESFGLKVTSKTKISEIQERMMQNKPADLSVYEYMRDLWERFGHIGRNEEIEVINPRQKQKPRTRKASEIEISESRARNIAPRSFYIQQKHKRLQLALKEKLIKSFGENCVVLFEENNVDVKLFQPEHMVFYEVKSSSYATNCIREALGQLLHYSFCDNDSRKKKLVVVGQYPPTLEDLKFIEYVKSLLNIEFEYESVRLDN
jgi:hypothetical protein